MSTTSDDAYVPGKGKIIREEQKAEEDKIDANKLATSLPNWAADIAKSQEIMNGDGEVPIPEPGDKNWYPVGTIEEQEGPDQDATGMTDDGVEEDIRADLSRGDSLVKFQDNPVMEKVQRQDNQCNQKEGVYCWAFRTITEKGAAFTQRWGEKLIWFMYTLYSPELEFFSGTKVTKFEEMDKARFTLPFRCNVTILRHCPDCGGDLSF